ncbi:MAG: type II toxin-antitoxin system VapC family toxin [Leptospiraceae bacterium]|nr:type II toxin-antitoxin system VapC family toxin [Leptospiraceae bacterium]
MLLDSNVLIYSIIPEYSFLMESFRSQELFASEISYLEVLGFSNITDSDKDDLQEILDSINLLEVNFEIIQKATSLRQNRKMSTGDAIIASTALIRDLPLVTANVTDFKWIKELKLINPFG